MALPDDPEPPQQPSIEEVHHTYGIQSVEDYDIHAAIMSYTQSNEYADTTEMTYTKSEGEDYYYDMTPEPTRKHNQRSAELVHEPSSACSLPN